METETKCALCGDEIDTQEEVYYTYHPINKKRLLCRLDGEHVLAFNKDLIKMKKINYKNFDPKKLDNVEVEGIDRDDSPDFCDAYVVSADYDGVKLTPDELEELFEKFPRYEGELIFDYMG